MSWIFLYSFTSFSLMSFLYSVLYLQFVIICVFSWPMFSSLISEISFGTSSIVQLRSDFKVCFFEGLNWITSKSAANVCAAKSVFEQAGSARVWESANERRSVSAKGEMARLRESGARAKGAQLWNEPRAPSIPRARRDLRIGRPRLRSA